MQETKVARPIKAFGQHMHYQAQKLRATHGARGQAFGFAVAPTVGDVVAVASQDVLLLNDTPECACRARSALAWPEKARNTGRNWAASPNTPQIKQSTSSMSLNLVACSAQH